ncbi:4-hydroxyphenylpyruvate dioxygenase, partial [Cucurbita argyrosperma subsp. argyrosperma]
MVRDLHLSYCSDNRAVLDSEVLCTATCVLRYISYKNPVSGDDSENKPDDWFLPKFEGHGGESLRIPLDFGIRKTGPCSPERAEIHGFHEFAEFTAEDVGTSEERIDSVVLATMSKWVCYIERPVLRNEAKESNTDVFWSTRRSRVQHLANGERGHFQNLEGDEEAKWRRRIRIFMPSPPPTYTRILKGRGGDCANG